MTKPKIELTTIMGDIMLSADGRLKEQPWERRLNWGLIWRGLELGVFIIELLIYFCYSSQLFFILTIWTLINRANPSKITVLKGPNN